MDNKYYDLRIQYDNPPLVEGQLPSSPIVMFQNWFEEALKSSELEPNGMVFSTAQQIGSEIKVRSRVVLLKEIDQGGFIFYTGLSSAKGQEISKQKFGALNFWWKSLQRQIRIEGEVVLVDRKKNQEYFSSRPRASQLAVLAQKQTRPMKSRDELMQKYLEVEKKYSKEEILDCPEDWGGLSLIPNYFEFWQGQPNRLHDRISYTNVGSHHWEMSRLSP
jgi:pyridoxamine-phosphate oxidase